MLQLTQQQLSAASNVPRSSIAEFEADERRPRQSTLESLRDALEEAGVRFTDEKGFVGVAIKSK